MSQLVAGNGREAKFAITVSASTSSTIRVVFWVFIVVFRQDFALLFTSSSVIRDTVSRMGILLAFMILINSVQPVLSGNALAFLVYSTLPIFHSSFLFDIIQAFCSVECCYQRILMDEQMETFLASTPSRSSASSYSGNFF